MTNRRADDFRDRARYVVSTDRQWRNRDPYRGQSLILDQHFNRHVTDQAGHALSFATPYEAQTWLERQWAAANGIHLDLDVDR